MPSDPPAAFRGGHERGAIIVIWSRGRESNPHKWICSPPHGRCGTPTCLCGLVPSIKRLADPDAASSHMAGDPRRTGPVPTLSSRRGLSSRSRGHGLQHRGRKPGGDGVQLHPLADQREVQDVHPLRPHGVRDRQVQRAQGVHQGHLLQDPQREPQGAGGGRPRTPRGVPADAPQGRVLADGEREVPHPHTRRDVRVGRPAPPPTAGTSLRGGSMRCIARTFPSTRSMWGWTPNP